SVRLTPDELVGLGGACQRVPMGVQPAGRQDEGKLMVRQLARLAMIARQERGSPGRRGVAPVEVTAFRAGMLRIGTGPLQVCGRAQAGAPRAGHTARPAGSEADELIPNLRCGREIESAIA